MPHRSPPRPVAALWVALLSSIGLVACEPGELDFFIDEDASLPVQAPADGPGGCAECHPRQVTEWLGSSHNYGGGLDATFQALELAANYVATHTVGGPRFRQNQICVSCHAPTTGLFDANGALDINATIREGLPQPAAPDGETPDAAVRPLEGYGRELRFPANNEDLLRPIARAIEVATTGDALASADQRSLTFQGITCDTCHKVGAPFDDRFDDPGRAGLMVCDPDGDLDQCIDEQFQECTDGDMWDPRCFRRSRQQHPHDPPVFDLYVASGALSLEREGSVRYGPFEAGDAAPATAHDVSSGSTEEARAFDLARHPDGSPFEGQARDVRPFIQSSHFCGTCHDVRIPPLREEGRIDDRDDIPGVRSETDRTTTLEPVHNEPFLRLENLYTEWFTSPLNLHPDTQGEAEAAGSPMAWPDNPYRNADGSARRVVCQDCHMSLYPYAPPGTYPGEVSHADNCDEVGHCGLTIAEDGAQADLRIRPRARVSTHNMTGVDVGLGRLSPVDRDLNSPSADLPNQRGDAEDEAFGLPVSLTKRRRQMLENAASISLAGTPDVLVLNPTADAPPETLQTVSRTCDDEACNLPVKVWVTNANGGHNISAGFSQERQIWVEFTIEDLSRPILDADGGRTGLYEVVDCQHAGIDDFYQRVVDPGSDIRYPERIPRSHSADGATDLVNRMTGIVPADALGPGEDPDVFHDRICRGMSGHLIDKPHAETLEFEADGRLDDEDILLHRIGNTLPSLSDGTQLLSWHVVDLGFDIQSLAVADDPLSAPPTPDLCPQPEPGVDRSLAIERERVARADQFHIVGLDPFDCQLTEDHFDPILASKPQLGVQTIDGGSHPLSEPDGQGGQRAGELAHAVTETSDERLEILYPFPEFPPMLPHYDADGRFHFGERFGLVYLTNIFYQTCECTEGNCEGPETLPPIAFRDLEDAEGNALPIETYDARGLTTGAVAGGAPVELHAQVPWVTNYPALPHIDGVANHHPLDVGDGRTPRAYHELLDALSCGPGAGEDCDPRIRHCADGGECGTPYREAFTFVPLNADHMPNNRALRMYRPQRHYYDIRVPRGTRGPLRVSVKLWFRHFPPEFLRLLARFSDAAYRRTCHEGKAQDYFPWGPLVVEGESAAAFAGIDGGGRPADIDQVERVLLDQAVFTVHIDERPAPVEPTWEEHIEPILQDHCVPCHSDVLRHGGLILSYDEYPQFDPDMAQDPWANLMRNATYADGDIPLVHPSDPGNSALVHLLAQREGYPVPGRDPASADAPTLTARAMPLGTDGISRLEYDMIVKWIENGARGPREPSDDR